MPFNLLGPPDPPDNCSLTNITAHTLTIECLPGYSGGLDQIFYLEVFSANPNRIIANLSSSEYPFFIAHGLPAGYTFRLVLYSSNSKGKSRSISITGSTLLAAQWKSGLDLVLKLFIQSLYSNCGIIFQNHFLWLSFPSIYQTTKQLFECLKNIRRKRILNHFFYC